MAKWRPSPDNLSSNDLIGRRLFGRPYHQWPVNPPKSDSVKLSPDAFEDTRLTEDLSVDRLGAPNPSKTDIIRLTSLADEEAAKLSKDFCGWMAVLLKDLRQVRVIASPLTLEKDGIDNPYHAEIDRSQAREKSQSFHLSVSLRQQFQEKGRYVPPLREQTTLEDLPRHAARA